MVVNFIFEIKSLFHRRFKTCFFIFLLVLCFSLYEIIMTMIKTFQVKAVVEMFLPSNQQREFKCEAITMNYAKINKKV